MNMHSSLIQKLKLYEFEMVQNTVEATKNICWAKDDGAVDYSVVTRWVKKFCTGCKNLNDQARSGRPKTTESEAMLQAIEANPASSPQAQHLSVQWGSLLSQP